MARKKQTSSQNSSFMSTLFPERVVSFLKTRAIEGSALVLALGGTGYGLSILSFTPVDPSFNTGTQSDNIHNWGGLLGAYASDLGLQTLGFASVLISLTMIFWGWTLFREKALKRWWLSVISLLGALLLASAALGRLPFSLTKAPYAGGSVGNMLLSLIADPIAALGFPYILEVTSVLCGLIALPLFIMASNQPFGAWARGVGSIYRLIASGITALPLRQVSESLLEAGEEALPSKPTTKADKPRKAKTAPRITTPKASIEQGAREKKEKQSGFFFSNDDAFTFPPLDLLQLPNSKNKNVISNSALEKNAKVLQSVLEDFGVKGDIVKVNPGPVVTLYELEPAPGIKSSRVISLSDDIARSMSAISVRVAVIPGRNVIGIEMPNQKRETVYLREMLASKTFENSKAKLPLILGKDIAGEPVIVDLAKMPHLLIAGTTGSGKSVGVNAMIVSLLYKLSPEKCRLIMIDPKMLELSIYDNIPNLMTNVVTEPKKAIVALKWAVKEMEDRYRAMSKMGVRNIEGYNDRLKEARKKGEILTRRVQTGFDPDTGKPLFEDQPIDMQDLPYIVIVVDEFADLMLVAGKEVEAAIQRLAQMARAAGLHLIMATQRPSVDVITGTIKANFPSRISFQVTSRIDSRTILGDTGAEHLLGMGDMLYMGGGGKLLRVHGPFVDDKEVEAITDHLRQQGEPEYIDSVTSDDGVEFDDSSASSALFGNSANSNGGDALYDQAVALVASEQKASTSFVQRHLSIGYNRAAKIIEQMEKEGVIGPANHVGKREVLVPQRDYMEA